MSMTRHPHHDQFRVICGSGFILGRPVPLPRLEKPHTDTGNEGYRRTAAQREVIREATRRAWARRKRGYG